MWITRLGAAAAVLSALLVGGTVTATPAAAAVGDICYGDLPSQAHDTLDLIEQGGPYPYTQDGTVFHAEPEVRPAVSRAPGSRRRRTARTPAPAV